VRVERLHRHVLIQQKQTQSQPRNVSPGSPGKKYRIRPGLGKAKEAQGVEVSRNHSCDSEDAGQRALGQQHQDSQHGAVLASVGVSDSRSGNRTVRVFEFLVALFAKPNSVKGDVESESEDQDAEESGAEVRYHHIGPFHPSFSTSSELTKR